MALILFTFQGNSGYGNMGSGLAGGYDSDAEAGLANQMGGGFGEKAVRLFIFARSSNPDPIFLSLFRSEEHSFEKCTGFYACNLW